MVTATRWTATFALEWKPLLTFTRRRLQLLDWFEENVDVDAFSEDGEHIGIAVGLAAQRLIVERSGLTIQLRTHKADLAPLIRAIAGSFDVLAPHNVRARLYTGAWSVPLAREYDESRKALAKRAVGDLGDTGEALDCATLTDIRTDSGLVAVEFGVVSEQELRDRLRDPALGRLATRTPARRPKTVDLPAKLPGASLFLDVLWHPTPLRPDVASADGVAATLSELENHLARLALAIQATL